MCVNITGSIFHRAKFQEEQDCGEFLATTLIIRGPRLSAVFGPEIQYSLEPRIIEVWLYN